MDVLHHLLVDHASEADLGVGAPQPVFEEWRRADERVQEDAERGLSRPAELSGDASAISRAKPLVSVEVEDPLAPGLLQRQVASLGEVAAPRMGDHPGSELTCKLDRAVGGARIHDDHLVDHARDRAQAVAQIALLVADDESRAEKRCAHARAGCGSAAAQQFPTTTKTLKRVLSRPTV